MAEQFVGWPSLSGPAGFRERLLLWFDCGDGD